MYNLFVLMTSTVVITYLFNKIIKFRINLFEKLWCLQKDNCQKCKGSRGGVKGNENIVNGKILCDYCDSDLMDR